MEERTFLDEGGVSVSNARFISQGQTYAMSGITSVKSFEQTPSRKGPIITAAVGAFIFIGVRDSGIGGFILGLALLAIAGFWWFNQKSDFSVLLSSASGEAKALTSKDGAFIGKVVNALNDAIVHRG